MDSETGELILADIALCVDIVDKVVWRVETEPLIQKTISKRHVRILMMLSASNNMENKKVHADLEQIREAVARRSNKLYSKIDMQSFTFDLVNRGYIHHLNHEDYGDLFAILPQGLKLLESAQKVLPSHYFEASRTPNFHFGVRQ